MNGYTTLLTGTKTYIDSLHYQLDTARQLVAMNETNFLVIPMTDDNEFIMDDTNTFYI